MHRLAVVFLSSVFCFPLSVSLSLSLSFALPRYLSLSLLGELGQATTTTTSSTSSSEGQLSCGEGQDVCAEVSFEDGARILNDVCFSAPCPVLCESATARKCPGGPQGEEFCLPIADNCPLLCGPGEVECYLENFDATGQRQEDSLQCVLQTELPCPCGRNALRCVDPRLGASCVAATEDCPTSCDSSSRLCLSASFTPEGAFQELQTQCSDPSQPCACGENAKPCSWTDTDGLKRDECFPTATNCPLTCSKVCSIADYNRSTGELLGVRQTCANESDACPCGDFAFRCQDLCVPGNFPCPPTCSSEEQLCVRPSFDDQGEHLATEQVCVPQGGSCGCGQGAFECTHGDGSSECLPTVGGHCPVYCAGGVQCPLVTNFHPDGAEIGQSPPSRECANTTWQCPCGSEAKWCESLGCIFKDADCPMLCTGQQKLCSLVDYTSEGIFLSYREICIDADVRCPCGLNTWRCPGSDLCLLPSQMAICPCASWQKACEITDYSRTGIPESSTVVLCVDPELQCPCGKNALSCPDPMDSSRAICAPEASGVIANECPRWCSAEQLRAGNETCTQIFLGDSDASVFKRTSCRAPGDCKPGLNTKACPSGAFLPVWQPCPLGEVTEGTVKQNRAVEVAKVFWQLKTLSPNWAGSLTTAAVRLQFALAIPSTIETSLVLLPGSVLMFQLVGEGQSEEGRRLQGAGSPGSVPRGPKEFAVIIRMQVQQGNPDATEAIALLGELDDRVGASVEISANTIQIDGETTAQPTSSFGPDGEKETSEDVIFLVLVTVALIVLCCCICLTAGICFIYHRRQSIKRVLAEAMQPSQDPTPQGLLSERQAQAPEVLQIARQAPSADPTDPPQLGATEARTAMFSARFNARNKDTEMKFRAVCELLRARDLKILMVDAEEGDDFGMLTLSYLQQLKDDNGVMLAVCTSDYAEITSSPYSSYAELRFALQNNIDVLPLMVDKDIYPPRPPSGEDHKFDKTGVAKGLVSMVMHSSLVFLDCTNKTEEQIADRIEAKLRAASSKQGHGAG
ncbi:LZTR1 [Symbiodinium sp. CCMP2456]|nr:LZTR1 [Symbiodinium sp. CCMP2456]